MGAGLEPDTLEAFMSQRYRWVYGAMQIMKRHAREIFLGGSGLSWEQRYQFLSGWLPWISDGLGMIVDVARSLITGQENTFHYYQQYHHYLSHGWPGALVVIGFLVCFAREHWRVALLCLLTFHLHLVCDLIGSRGPTPGDLWPIAYAEPLFHHPVFFWKGQWRLDGWQNRIITLALVLAEIALAPRRGYSCVEVFSRRADQVFVSVLRKWRASWVGAWAGRRERGA
jgi:hypothetical protein